MPPRGAGEEVNSKRYGACRVWTQIDSLHDKGKEWLRCKNTRTKFRLDVIYVRASHHWVVTLHKQGISYTEPSIPVAYRFDDGSVTQLHWGWSQQYATAMMDAPLFIALFLGELQAARLMVVEMGPEWGIIELDRATQAVQDFEERSGGELTYRREILQHVIDPCWRMVTRSQGATTKKEENEMIGILVEKNWDWFEEKTQETLPFLSGQPRHVREAQYKIALTSCLEEIQYQAQQEHTPSW